MISRVNMQLPLRQSTRHVSKSLTHGTLHPALYLSGLQTQNTALVGLLANMCNMPIVLPFTSRGATDCVVVLTFRCKPQLSQ